MTEERMHKLSEIGFDIGGESIKVRQDHRRRLADKGEVAWEKHYNDLLAYKERFGNCDVKERRGDHEYKKLAGWVGLQRCVVMLCIENEFMVT
jgi:hypothetical protein